MNWDLWKTFGVIAKAGSLSAAARDLAISPATVGRHVAQLEQELGITLFKRLPDGYVLTLEGQAFVPLTEEMATLAGRLARKGAALGNAGQTMVRIAAGNWFSRFLMGHAGAARRALPGIEITLLNAYAFANLARHDADIAIRNRKPEQGRVALRRLPDIAMAIYAATTYVAAHPEARTKRRFEACHWIGFPNHLAHLPSAKWLRSRRQRPAEIQCQQSTNILDAVIGGGGLALLPRFVGDADTRLACVSSEKCENRIPNWLLIHEDLRRAPAVRATADWIGLLCDQNRDRFDP